MEECECSGCNDCQLTEQHEAVSFSCEDSQCITVIDISWGVVEEKLCIAFGSEGGPCWDYEISSDGLNFTEINEEDEDITFVTMKDAPVISKRKKQKKRKAHHKKIQIQKKQRPTKNRHNIEKTNSNNNKTIDTDDDSRFNSEEYHQKQHDL